VTERARRLLILPARMPAGFEIVVFSADGPNVSLCGNLVFWVSRWCRGGGSASVGIRPGVPECRPWFFPSGAAGGVSASANRVVARNASPFNGWRSITHIASRRSLPCDGFDTFFHDLAACRIDRSRSCWSVCANSVPPVAEILGLADKLVYK
jgi:hypothetical protein